MAMRRSLLLATVGLTTAGVLLLNGAAVLALRSYLVGQIDTQLRAGAWRADAEYSRAAPADPAPGGAQSMLPAAPASEHVIEVSSGRTGTAPAAHPLALTLLDRADLDEPAPQEVTGYRVLVVREGARTVLVAHSLGPVDATVYKFTGYLTLTSLLVLALLTLAAREVLTRRLRPLDEITVAAAGLSAAPPPDPALRPRGRFGQLTTAIHSALTWTQTSTAVGHAAQQPGAARRAPVDLAAVVRDVVIGAAAADPARELSMDTPAVCMVTGDEGALRRALSELLADVRAHTPPAAPARVTLAVEPDTARVLVTGSGPGPDPATAALAFDRYWRPDTARTASGGPAPAPGLGPAPDLGLGPGPDLGLGLGLATVAEVARAHGGEAGTTGPAVWITVPLPRPGH